MNINQGHEYVDLGLPSGTLWATCNVGANKPEDYGNYLSWDDGKTAAANWGKGWRLPSKEQWEELMENTKSIWTTRNGKSGGLFTANNGKGLFLPAAGFRWDDESYDAGGRGHYWTSSRYTNYPDDAWFFYFSSDDYHMSSDDRDDGRSVRPVRSAPQK